MTDAELRPVYPGFPDLASWPLSIVHPAAHVGAVFFTFSILNDSGNQPATAQSTPAHPGTSPESRFTALASSMRLCGLLQRSVSGRLRLLLASSLSARLGSPSRERVPQPTSRCGTPLAVPAQKASRVGLASYLSLPTQDGASGRHTGIVRTHLWHVTSARNVLDPRSRREAVAAASPPGNRGASTDLYRGFYFRGSKRTSTSVFTLTGWPPWTGG